MIVIDKYGMLGLRARAVQVFMLIDSKFLLMKQTSKGKC